MKTSYVVMTDCDYDTDGVSRHRILAVCPDEGTAQEYQELCEFDSVIVKAPLMDSSRPVMRGGE